MSDFIITSQPPIDCSCQVKVDNENHRLTKPLLNPILDTASGKAAVTTQSIDAVDMDSTSVTLLLTVEEVPDNIDISTGSGAVTLILPEDTGTTLRFNTVSGRLSSELPGETGGKNSVFGDGACECSVKTTSGDLRIKVNGRHN